MSLCDEYSWYSPYSWICNSGAAMTSGLSSGALNGVEKQVEQAIGKLADGLSRAAQQSFSNVNGEVVGEKVGQFVKDFFSKLKENTDFSVDSKDLGRQLAENFKDFGTEFHKSLGLNGSNVGEGVARELDRAFNGFWDEIRLTENTVRFTDEFKNAFSTGVKNADFAGNIKLAADEIGEGMKAFREAGVREVDAFRSDVQGIFANMARDTTLRMIPWIALGGAILVGTPLLTMYVYKKAVYNIGRPQLAQEVRKVGLWDRTSEGVSNTISSLWSSAKTGIKWGAIAGTAGFALTVVGALALEIMTGDSGAPGDVLSGLSCAMGFQRYYCNSDPAFPLVAATVASGLLGAGSNAVRNFYQFAKKAMKKDEKPVFNDEIQNRIEELTKAVYNIRRNGGYMQNLLLYGPGGTGKTMVSKYIAKNSKMNYVMMSGGDLAQYIKRGEHVTEINKLFESAKNSHTPTILFIDECESLCGDRGKMDKSELIELVNSFLNHTGEPSKKVMVILTTNRPQDLDPAVLSRMDHKLYIGLPLEEGRRKILELYIPLFMTSLERKKIFTAEMISAIAERTEGFSGRTIFKMLNSISCLRATTSNNMLTEKMVSDTIDAFVKQEGEIEEKLAQPRAAITIKPIVNAVQQQPIVIQQPVIETPIDQATPAAIRLDVDEVNPIEEQIIPVQPIDQPVINSLNSIELTPEDREIAAVENAGESQTNSPAKAPLPDTLNELESLSIIDEKLTDGEVNSVEDQNPMDTSLSPVVNEVESVPLQKMEEPASSKLPNFFTIFSRVIDSFRSWITSSTLLNWMKNFFVSFAR